MLLMSIAHTIVQQAKGTDWVVCGHGATTALGILTDKEKTSSINSNIELFTVWQDFVSCGPAQHLGSYLGRL